MRYIDCIPLVVILLPLTTLAAQVEPGTRVTLSGIAAEQLVGTFTELSADTLTLDRYRVPLASITRLEVSRGRSSSWLETGMAVGLIGAVVGLSGGGDAQGNWTEAAAVILAVPGFLVGAVIGSAIQTDRWDEVSLENLSAGVALLPDGGVALGASICF
ncbi:MAG: hypothetical protein HKM89_14545 [Gemmatimonadales bacterium]|nr:hypothetical protein [Gemmatimonadales bacterium]